jgi:hypothetical protein
MTSKMSHNFRILGDESTGHLLESLNWEFDSNSHLSGHPNILFMARRE